MKLEIKNLPNKLLPLLSKLKRYLVFVFVMVMLGLFGLLVLRINKLNAIEPSEEAITEKLQTAPRPKFDQATLDKIEELEDNSVNVRALFKEARKNPFNE